MKTLTIATIALAAMSMTAEAHDHKRYKHKPAQAQGQIQGQAQGQYQSSRQSSSQSVHVETPEFTYGAHLGLSTTANGECDRVIFGLIPYSGHNCNYRMESAKLGDIVERLNSGSRAVRAGARAEMLMWAKYDASARRALRELGLIK